MKAYILKEQDLARLLAMIDRDPRHGYRGGSSSVPTEAEQRAHEEAHRFFNYQVRTWIGEVKSDA